MRSSIACVKCRRSKVKCLNNGPGTPCRACQTNGRECIYPEPVTDRSHRQNLSHDRPGETPITPDVTKSARSKVKKTATYGSNIQSSRPLIDALNSAVLTPHVWLELLEIWERHYAIDFPFIHSPTFQDLLRQAKSVPPFQDFATPRQDVTQNLPPLPHEFLLAFLALTSKYQSTLITHHSSRTPIPRAASEYYATACKNKLDMVLLHSTEPPVPSLSRVQAFLMLAFYEWGNCEDINAWEKLTHAIREARLIGLTQGDSNTRTAMRRSFAVDEQRPQTLEQQQIDRESRRRTFWCCFSLERLLSSGLFRPTSLRTTQITVPLPISQPSFLFNRVVKTLLITDAFEQLQIIYPDEKKITSANITTRSDTDLNAIVESGPIEGVLTKYLKGLELFNAIIYWACAGGRLNERHAPWDDSSSWGRLYSAVVAYEGGLPRDLRLSPGNISAHRSTSSLGAFTLLHTVLLLCKILLHREWIPFIPFESTEPKGPKDQASPFLTRQHDDRPLFWEHSAAELFRSTKSLADLLSTSHDCRVLPETPLIGYASFVVAIIGLYSTHFPWMDVAEQMSKSDHNSTVSSGSLALFTARDGEIARKASELVVQFRPTLKMADNWFTILQLTHRHFTRVKKIFRRNYRNETFGRSEIGKARSALATIADIADEDHKSLDLMLGRYSEDVEMQDALQNGLQQATDGAARDDLTWTAINTTSHNVNGGAMHHNNAQSSHQSSVLAVQLHQATSPSAQTPSHASPSSAMHTIPHFHPTLPSGLSTRYPFVDSASAVDPSIAPQIPKDQNQSDGSNLEIKFGGQDLLIFVEGIAAKDVPGIGGWISAVFSRAPGNTL